MTHNSDLKSKMAESALTHLISDPDELMRFMQLSGYSPDLLRRSLDSPEFQSAVIGYFAQSEPLLLAMCANSGFTPQDFMRVWNEENRFD